MAAIRRDHEKVRQLIEATLDEESPLKARRAVFRALGGFLAAHAAAEEKSIYALGKKRTSLRAETLECVEEHGFIESLLRKTLRAKTPEVWKARARIFCGLVEQHLELEEDDFLPALSEAMTAEEDARLITKYRRALPAALAEEEPGPKEAVVVALDFRRPTPPMKKEENV